MPTVHETGAPYPEAEADQQRFVINLPSERSRLEQNNLQVQVIVGRHVEGDDGHRYVYSGDIQEREIQGWGYNYWVASLEDPIATRSNPSAKPKDGFIPLHDSPVIRYNSKLPIVVYAPHDAEVRYKIWADEEGRRARGEAPHMTVPAAAPDAVAAVRSGEGRPVSQGSDGGGAGGYPTEDHAARDVYPQEAAHDDNNQDHHAVTHEAEEAEKLRELAPEHETAAAREAVYPGGEEAEAEAAKADHHHTTTDAEAGEAPKKKDRSGSKTKKTKKSASLVAEDVGARKESASNNGVAPLSSTEMSPSAVKSRSAASPKRSVAHATDDSNIKSGSKADSKAKKDRSGSEAKKDKERRDSSPVQARNKNGAKDKYREL